MRGKRAITPVIAVILLIVMTVGIAAFTFVWMQNFVQSLQTQTQQQAQQLQRPQFTITYAAYDDTNNEVKFVLTNMGGVPIDTSQLKVTIEEYEKIDGSFVGTKVLDATPQCDPETVAPNQDTTCSVSASGLDLKNRYYIIIATYKGVTAHYTLRR